MPTRPELVCVAGLLLSILFIPENGFSQSAQSLVAGKVSDYQSGKGIANATVWYSNAATREYGSVTSDSDGKYAFPLLSPGTYRFRTEMVQYQSREIHSVDVHVAARLEINFPLQLLKQTGNAGSYNTVFLPKDTGILPIFGPDLETGGTASLDSFAVRAGVLQPALSYVLTADELNSLPLSARNIYTTVVTLPGVTAETVSGLAPGLSANGQRASSSNYLLDGLESNDYLLSGPFAPVAPEQIQEYRITTQNYSAEYGQTGGFIANAITRHGSNALHGLLYSYIGNDVLNANTFQRNTVGYQKPLPLRQLYAGYSTGGAILKDKLFFSSAFEYFRHRSTTDPIQFYVLLADPIRRCSLIPSNSQLVKLFNRFSLPASFNDGRSLPACTIQTAYFTTTEPASLDGKSIIERLDYHSKTDTYRVMGRAAISKVKQPDATFSPYEGLNSDLSRTFIDIGFNVVQAFAPNMINESRLGVRTAEVKQYRPHPELPGLTRLGYVDQQLRQLDLPNQQFFDFRSRDTNWELGDSLRLARSRHLITAGGGVLFRSPDIVLNLLQNGLYDFSGADYQTVDIRNPNSVTAFNNGGLVNLALDQPRIAQFSTDRQSLGATGTISPPNYQHTYSNKQFYGFLQEQFKASRNLNISAGIRYESFGTLTNTGTPDGYIKLGEGQNVEERLAGAQLAFDSGQHGQPYRPDRNNWAGRLGIAYSGLGNGQTVLRAGYGIFYDRPNDSYFFNPRNNAVITTYCVGAPLNAVAETQCAGSHFAYLDQPLTAVYSGRRSVPIPVFHELADLDSRVESLYHPPELLWIDGGLRTPYVQSWFGGVQQQIGRNFHIEVSHAGSAARKLISSDYVNRECGSPCGKLFYQRINQGLGDILYRSNSGASNYKSLQVLARYGTHGIQLHAAYTYSHSIDNQSNPLLKDMFNLNSFNPNRTLEVQNSGTFTRQFDSRVDRGSSDFDLRHNLVVYSIWNLPEVRKRKLSRVLSGWRASTLARFSSGFPLTVYSASETVGDGGGLIANRANLVPGAPPFFKQPVSYLGGQLLLDSFFLSSPQPGQVGNVGRNSLYGPGFWNVDASISKSFFVPRLGESKSIQFRADAFNIANHSNLTLAESSREGGRDLFGRAYYGNPLGGASSFAGGATPFFPTARRIQLQLAVHF